MIYMYYIGLADCVLALGFEKMQRGSLTSQVKNSYLVVLISFLF